ncbi:AAA family ATPase [Inconstantimicrobium mannanitabidum]|uniref:ATPase n=1 Tax=Inconstantimicrobium mannanitabidum TaxID=1604901 RepID=A0ACB5RFD4_9CLOT|nr:MoxR family ATPase [Clostridium sp. TW13]GKX67729.1 ATPase [Clostridium sp. TW13]
MKQIDELIKNISKVIIGKEETARDILKVLLSNGHILIEDVPGTGKTTLIKTLAKSIDLNYSRIQCTPDLLPSDIIGVSIFNEKTREFEFKKGPVFSNFILVDEINRTSPKTQSALLEVMEEKQVSDWSDTYIMSQPFIVFATENPIEHEGTFNLPEAQLDRFSMKISIGYPSLEQEKQILSIYSENNPFEDIKPVMTGGELRELQEKTREVFIKQDLNDYLAEIAAKIRDSELVSVGVSTRAILSLQKISQATALLNDRDYMLPDDIKENVIKSLSHRIILSRAAQQQGLDEIKVLEGIMKNVEVPKVRV